MAFDTPPAAPVDSRPRPSVVKWLLRRAYTSNPFYVISADLVFLGLRMSLDTSGKSFETEALMVSLLGYTLLLATTGCLLIRLGNVWDDVRTILLLVVAMFLAISVTFDETLARNPRLGIRLYLGGLGFAVAVSEGLLRGIRLRLPALYRVVYYLVLAQFFLYPVALVPLLRAPDSPALQWMLFGFAPLAGLLFLGLIPAVRGGAGYVAKNGSPWRYPLYPWVLFGLLGAAVCGRAFYLCISFHFVGKSDSIFGPYFLVPFLLAIDLLILEAGIVWKKPSAECVAFLLLPLLVYLAATGHRPDPVYQQFLHTFMHGLGGSPLFLTLVAVAAVCALAAVRGVDLGYEWLVVTLIALVVVGPRTLNLESLATPQPVPLLVLAGLQIASALRQRVSWLFLTGSSCAVLALAMASARAHPELVALHSALGALLLAGLLFDDPLARFCQRAGALVMAIACLGAFWIEPTGVRGIGPQFVRAYPFVLGLVAAGYAALSGCRLYLAAACTGLMGWVTVVGWQNYLDLRRLLVGLDWIAGGLAFFALAAVISLNKAGVWARWHGFRRARRGFADE